jgi:TP901 family phage tail tape measure protein
MANPVTIELKILTAKAGSNVKALAKQTGELKISMDSATQSIHRNRDEQGRFVPQTQKTTDVVDDQGKAYDRLKQRANKTFGKAGLVSLYAGAGLAAGAMYNRTISRGRDFQQQLADLEAITGITGDQLQELGEDALDLSIEYGEAASNIIEANKLVASQLAEKIDFGTAEGAAELAKVSEEAIVLQKAAGVDLPTAVKTLTTAINQFNLPASESARLINSIAAGSKFGAAEVGNQAEAYKQAGSVAAGANLSFEELNATVQVLAANAIVGGQAGTNIRGILLSLQNAAKLAEAGVQGVSLETHGYTGTLEALKPVLEDTVALEKLFGRENIASARILIQNASSVEEMTDKVTGGNVAYEQAAIQMDTWNGSASSMGAAIDSVLIPAFQRQGGVTVDLMNLTTDLIESFAGGLDVINDWVAAFDRMNDARGTIANLADSYTDLIIPLRITKTLLEKTGLIESNEKYKELFETIDDGSQSIQDQVQYLVTSTQVFQKEREELEAGSKAYEDFTTAIDRNIQSLSRSKSEFQSYLTDLENQRKATEEGSFAYAELTEKMNQAQVAIDLISNSLESVTEHTAAATEQTQIQSEAAETLGTKFKANKERIDELIGSTDNLSAAEWNELQSLTAQNQAIQEQIDRRKELAELGSDLRPQVENPEPISIPIELDTTELDRMVDEGLINLDVPLKSIDGILSELNKDVSQYVEMSAILGDHTGDMEFAMRRTEQAMQELIENGYHPQSAEIQNLIAQLQDLQAEYQRTEEVNYLANFAGEQLAGAITGIHQVSESLDAQKARILDRAKADKAAAKSASERARIEARAQEQISQAEEQAKERRKQIIRDSVTAAITEAAIMQFGKVIKTIPFPLNVIIAPIAAAAVAVGMNKLMNFNTGGIVPGAASETRDTVPAMLTPGEFVIRKDSASAAPTAMRVINEDPKAAAKVEELISSGNFAKTQSNLARSAIALQSSSDRSIRKYNSGGLVTPISAGAMQKVIARESTPGGNVVIQAAGNFDRLVDEIRNQTEEMKKMKLETEIIFSEFKEKYDDFVASEAELGR